MKSFYDMMYMFLTNYFLFIILALANPIVKEIQSIEIVVRH